LAGIVDALDLAREATDRLHDGRRTLTVTWHQLDDTLAELSANVHQTRPDLDEDVAAHLADLAAQAEITADIASAFASERGDNTGADMLFWIAAARRSIESHQKDIGQSSETATLLATRLGSLEATARSMALEMGYAFLLDPVRKLLSIGYRVTEGSLDPSCCDLLASEARLASFIAIAKGDVPARHWFHLGRTVTPIAHGAALISWSGSMFEYLMPSLVMRAPAGSLLEQTSRLIVRRQIAYGTSLGQP
jgi:cyclic beta-1,2-glucan synthetase